ncbi:ATP-dependent RNA [Chrysochromulina tobinii]|uniref:ATP-dependent RNA n=1 Tax=Chrysochromulina tobinii TaxID=1460289 RepID=A0A0M0JI25_9EUKA|nr:ATP-dependent RNA [Chrysochromulina tobinii]|eukprot:KOO25957.1 ATP-dependent RNA [Chrysochromulina sp. CCMP291]
MTWKRQKVDDKDALPVLKHKQEVPQFLLDSDPKAKIVVTQPRRLAARALAERVTAERGSVIGRTIGYAVSRDKATTLGTTRCTFVTVGLLLQLLVFRPADVFNAYTHIIVDEAHERDVDLDLLLLLLRRALRRQASGRDPHAAVDAKEAPRSTACQIGCAGTTS